MISQCCVLNCDSKSDINSNTKFIKFLNCKDNEEKINRWKRLAGLHLDESIKGKRICNRHFEPNQFMARKDGRLEFNESAIPCLNLPNNEMVQ